MRLQVGDIEMDSPAGISFGRGAWVVFGALALGLVIGLALALGIFSGVQGNVRFLPLMGVLGLLLGASIAFFRATMTRRRSEESAVDAVDKERATRLSEHLVGRFEAASIEELMAELDWEEEAVIRGLQVGMERHLIVEELDLDSGHWIYATEHDDATGPQAIPSGAQVEQRARQRHMSIPDKLLKLSRLRAAGVLAERDFQVQKMRLLR